MEKFDSQEFEHLKKLCRIACSPEEEREIHESLRRVLSYVEQLSEVDTEGVASCYCVLRTVPKQQLREDVATDLLPREQFLSNVPDHVGGMVRVPPVLKTP